MPGLILEGGTFRPIFSCGVMDALLAHGLMFDYIVGVSAGITDAASYVSQQPERNLEIVRRYRNDPRYCSLSNFYKCGSLFGLDFVFREIPETLLPFDWTAYRAYPGRMLVGVTNARTGLPAYFDGHRLDRDNTILRATCAIPLVFPPIWIDGAPYYDGGLTEPIPIRKALRDGSKKNLIVLTRTKDYRKTTGRATRFAAHALRYQFPALPRVLWHRAKHYNDTVCFINQLQRRQPENTVVLRPPFALESFESDIEKLEAGYRAGYALAESRMDAIRALFD